ncbi:MAB_1171c family putative transporter [Micromonospora sp. BQ11]|uniref:MAB_1171c family putative transporter n=1 Tax=Micromonospora sp. BQ11 TaxID=3452212 RepID=UPI003F892812
MIAVTLICWGMSLYKLRDLAGDRGNRPLRALCLALIAITISMTLQPLMPKVDQLVGVPDVARLTSNCLSLVCATAAQAFLLYMTSGDVSTRRRVRRRTVALALTITVMIVLFVAIPSEVSLADPRVRSGEYYGEPFHAPFLFVYLAYLGWSLTQVVVLANRYAGIAHRPLLRFGLRMITVGSLWGLAYVAAKLMAVGLGTRSADWALITDAVVVLTFSTSILLVLLGSTIPSWGPRVGCGGPCAARPDWSSTPTPSPGSTGSAAWPASWSPTPSPTSTPYPHPRTAPRRKASSNAPPSRSSPGCHRAS